MHTPSGKDPLDETDRGIIQVLQDDGRMPLASIAERLGVPLSTISRRLNRLLQRKVLRIVAVPDSLQLGLPVHVVIGVQAAVSHADAVGSALAQLGEVRWLAMTAGQFDFLFEAFLASNDHFHRFLTVKLGQIDGVQRVETLTVVRQLKSSYAWSELMAAGGVGLAPDVPTKEGPLG